MVKMRKWVKAYVQSGMTTATSPSCAVYLIACNTSDPGSQQPESFEMGVGVDTDDLGVSLAPSLLLSLGAN